MKHMQHFQKILVGIDVLSRENVVAPGSKNAVNQAIWLAKETGGRLTILHSTWTDTYSDVVDGANVVKHIGLADEARVHLDELVAEVEAQGLSCELRIESERPWLALTRAAITDGFDVVLVAKRNVADKDGSRRLGSVATKLLRKCPSAVWTVKPEHDLVMKLGLAATDLTAVGDQAVRYGAYITSKHGYELHVLHAYQTPLQLQMEASTLSEDEYAARIEAIKSSAQSEIQGVLAGAELGSEPILHIGRNTPSIAIREAVEHLHPDLVVMGTISRAGVAGMLVGNTAEKLLARIDCSLLCVKPNDFVSPVAG